ncbi:MAG TPA: pentapeptide repeat-containing protein [Phototrophicaceae bacterium]|nr:pentapeptide repeat-containing protein [Phototrophicaceae bacterium]
MAAKKSRESLVRRIKRLFQENQWLYLIIGVMLGLLVPELFKYARENLRDLLWNLVPEAMGMSFTLLILDRLNESREERQVREQLVRQLHSYYNPVAMQALEELRVLGYLSDGTLHSQDFRGADWRDGNFYEADLSGCDLRNAKIQKADFVDANLKDAQVSEDQLAATDIMWKCVMPDGKLYNGKYNLPHDFEVAARKNYNPNDPASMAEYYGVSVEDYLEGQEWAQQNADKLRLAAKEREKTMRVLAA